MGDDAVRRDPARVPVHPGENLREDVLPGLGLPVSTTARHLGGSRQALHRVLAGRAAVSPEMALRIGKLCGDGPGVWRRLQVADDLWDAERSVDGSGIPTLRVASGTTISVGRRGNGCGWPSADLRSVCCEGVRSERDESASAAPNGKCGWRAVRPLPLILLVKADVGH